MVPVVGTNGFSPDRYPYQTLESFRIPDPASQKVPDPNGSGSTTLPARMINCNIFFFLFFIRTDLEQGVGHRRSLLHHRLCGECPQESHNTQKEHKTVLVF